VITEVSLKVLPVPPAEATLEFACSQADALRLLNEWGGRPLPLNASCWFGDQGEGALYLRLRGAVAAVEAACAHLGGERKDNARAATDWQSLRDQQLPWFSTSEGTDALWRVSVPQTAPVLALDGAAPLIEWHGGQRWYKAAADPNKPRASARSRVRPAAMPRCSACRLQMRTARCRASTP
jgi:glycolate oxidase FAD binding subunit